MINKLSANPDIGFKWAVRASGFLVAFVLVMANLLLRTRLPPRKAGDFVVGVNMFRDWPFVLLCLAVFFGLWGLYLPFTYLVPFIRL